MNLQHRVDLLIELGRYILSENEEWKQAKHVAGIKNGWFIPEFVDRSVQQIANSYLSKEALEHWIAKYNLPAENKNPRTIGLVMAGNIPLVGFHDFLAVFITGHHVRIKPSSKDEVLIKHLIGKLTEWNAEVSQIVSFSELLKGCDAYIATGSNNSSRYFDYYFGKYPNIIRRNRTSVAILNGDETAGELGLLADDVYLYFGLGCRNVTKIYVPEEYDFVPLLSAFKKYNYLSDHHKYKNNYDYNLALHMLNKKFYMSNESILLVEEKSFFSPISQLNYEHYTDEKKLAASLAGNEDLQCIVGKNHLPFGAAQSPSIDDFADGVDTMDFLVNEL